MRSNLVITSIASVRKQIATIKYLIPDDQYGRFNTAGKLKKFSQSSVSPSVDLVKIIKENNKP